LSGKLPSSSSDLSAQPGAESSIWPTEQHDMTRKSKQSTTVNSGSWGILREAAPRHLGGTSGDGSGGWALKAPGRAGTGGAEPGGPRGGGRVGSGRGGGCRGLEQRRRRHASKGAADVVRG
jgi:hypothetical protein